MHLRRPEFTYSACWAFTRKKEKIAKFKEAGDPRYIYQDELDVVSFQHYMTYGDFKDYYEEKFLIKHVVIKHLVLLKIQNMIDINVVLLQWFINFDKKLSDSGVKSEIILNQQLAEESHKPIIRKFKEQKALF